MAKNKNRPFTLQWHVTALCDQSCRHCYAKDERTYKQEINDPLSFNECKGVVDDLISFSEKVEAKPHIAFTGGDPLLHQNFFDIANYAKNNGIDISILGNPFHVNKNISKLKDLDLRSYQISIDGMKEKHDKLRSIGSFDASIKAFEELKENDIRTVGMFTLSKYNAEDLIPTMKLASDNELDVFAFARVCGFGSGKNMETLHPLEYRNLLLDVYEEERRLKDAGSKTFFNKKDHLWVPLLEELGELPYKPKKDGKKIYGGCSIGCNSLSMLADGTVFACRRFYSPVGKILEQSIEEIFVSDELESYRLAEYEKCSSCNLLQYCRGCPAVAYGETGRFTAPDPQCWR